jgi:NarL family two-component system response regulator YdfI
VTDQYILIIEDDPAWQKMFSDITLNAGFKPVVAATYHEGLTALSQRHYALAVTDMSLSELYHDNRDGLKLLRQIAALPEPLPAIVVTGYPSIRLAVETLVDLKAIHFFSKDEFDRRKFAQTLQKEAIPRRETSYVSPLIPNSFRPKVDPHVAAWLSERELEVIYFLSQGQTNKEIAAAMTVTVNTIKKHLQSIYTKLNVTSRAAAVAKALNVKR